jgi:hypothetical protein
MGTGISTSLFIGERYLMANPLTVLERLGSLSAAVIVLLAFLATLLTTKTASRSHNNGREALWTRGVVVVVAIYCPSALGPRPSGISSFTTSGLPPGLLATLVMSADRDFTCVTANRTMVVALVSSPLTLWYLGRLGAAKRLYLILTRQAFCGVQHNLRVLAAASDLRIAAGARLTAVGKVTEVLGILSLIR